MIWHLPLCPAYLSMRQGNLSGSINRNYRRVFKGTCETRVSVQFESRSQETIDGSNVNYDSPLLVYPHSGYFLGYLDASELSSIIASFRSSGFPNRLSMVIASNAPITSNFP